MEKKVSYSEALAEIEKILEGFNDPKLDIDTLADKVKRASELITLCKNKLHKAEKDIEKILEK